MSWSEDHEKPTIWIDMGLSGEHVSTDLLRPQVMLRASRLGVLSRSLEELNRVRVQAVKVLKGVGNHGKSSSKIYDIYEIYIYIYLYIYIYTYLSM